MSDSKYENLQSQIAQVVRVYTEAAEAIEAVDDSPVSHAKLKTLDATTIVLSLVLAGKTATEAFQLLSENDMEKIVGIVEAAAVARKAERS
ncbi:hypothetical protein Wildcat_55 [Mycobacterium phage Wildcat]|uniref:Uncharacterized protein n=3 Tax=Mycobacterium virus Wildcat TaxID=1993859 RepID=Q19Y05_9CAUD|nr:hypothetical protein Wildcat_55 [Mycobacterium phage Wildcat]ABE67660.1 hypothetical protein Wildcat_55 [Mycobacterium phage Wildcat]AJD82127.1 hypothetical protein COSMO_55 [Mycobacterium phage Cosmo]QGJ89945.1 hypothetical protein PBI_MARYV_55 [Mycobacterium phage MaryV]WKR36065.1 hypothetical protein [Mycobacterium phage Azrael100]